MKTIIKAHKHRKETICLSDQEKTVQDPVQDVPEQSAEETAAQTPPADDAQKKYDDLNDRYLRMLAEYDNFRKRSQREKDAVYPAAVAATVEKFLPVIDSFDRALACECSDPEFFKGVELIHSALRKTLDDLGATAFGEVGDAFDANIHNAVMHTEDEAYDANTVCAVLQKGYRIGDRVLRYAMVTVAN